VTAFQLQFFPAEPQTDLSDIENCTYPPQIETPQQITPEDVAQAMNKQLPFSAPGKDGIPNGFLKALGKPFTEALAPVINACWEKGHYPQVFKCARTVALKKPGKGVYTTPKSWRPVALLNTVGKVIEAVTARYIRNLAEQHHLLPEQQRGACLTSVHVRQPLVKKAWLKRD